jgi:SAM-dependent methyltransferase
LSPRRRAVVRELAAQLGDLQAGAHRKIEHRARRSTRRIELLLCFVDGGGEVGVNEVPMNVKSYCQYYAGRVDEILRRKIPAWRARRKYHDELSYWRGELGHLNDWFVKGTRDWWGIRPPTASERLNVSDLWAVNAVMTMHRLRPSYSEELGLGIDHFDGQRVLEVGSGPLAPLLQFTKCHRYCLDPLVDLYVKTGWPLLSYHAHFNSAPGERMPYSKGYFNSVISVNALDHVDDFEQVASEMQRVVKPGGRIYFEVEYHEPTVTEPVVLSDGRIVAAFSQCKMEKVLDRSGREMFEALVQKFNLIPNQFQRFDKQRFVTWHATRLSQ